VTGARDLDFTKHTAHSSIFLDEGSPHRRITTYKEDYRAMVVSRLLYNPVSTVVKRCSHSVNLTAFVRKRSWLVLM
jgi:hypothetical protein